MDFMVLSESDERTGNQVRGTKSKAKMTRKGEIKAETSVPFFAVRLLIIGKKEKGTSLGRWETFFFPHQIQRFGYFLLLVRFRRKIQEVIFLLVKFKR